MMVHRKRKFVSGIQKRFLGIFLSKTLTFFKVPSKSRTWQLIQFFMHESYEGARLVGKVGRKGSLIPRSLSWSQFRWCRNIDNSLKTTWEKIHGTICFLPLLSIPHPPEEGFGSKGEKKVLVDTHLPHTITSTQHIIKSLKFHKPYSKVRIF